MVQTTHLHWSAPLWFVFVAAPAFAVEPDFSFYPAGAHDCLNESYGSADCASSTFKELNECLCGNNSDFILNSASCVAEQSPDDVDSTYNTMREACSDSNTPISVNRSAWNDAASNQSSSPTSDTPSTATATSPSETGGSGGSGSSGSNGGDEEDGNSGLSTETTIGIAVASSLIGALAVAGIAWFLFRRYRKRTEEARPMLPQHEEMGNTAYDGAAAAMLDSKSPAPTYQSSMGSPTPGYHAPQHMAPVELPPENETRFEMEGSTVSHQGAVEMPGSTPSMTQQEFR